MFKLMQEYFDIRSPKTLRYLIWLPFWVLFLSTFQSIYAVDPHHWGLMLSNAKDLYQGKLPYKEIYIQYGFLTTFIQAFAYGIGKNLLSIMIVTAVFYATGIVLLFFLAKIIYKIFKFA